MAKTSVKELFVVTNANMANAIVSIILYKIH